MIKKRIEYIDALRGFTMMLVVFAHVEAYGIFGMQYTSFLGSIFQLFRMPLFFFISGYIAYKNSPPSKDLVFKKLRVQIIPATIFALIYCHFNISRLIYDAAKAGYWFTYVLLEMFLIYYCIQYISYKIKKNKSNVFDVGVITIAIVFYILRLPLKSNPTLDEIGRITSFHYLFSYFIFFVFGLLASKYKGYLERIMDNKYIIGVSIVIFGIGCYFAYYTISPLIETGNHTMKILYEIIETICAYVGIIIVFNFFRKHESAVSNSTKLGKGLQFIGRRTLDIYLLHYFLLPSLPMLRPFFIEHPNMVLELFVCTGISLLVVGVCLIFSEIIRTSTFLSYWLFGTKSYVNKMKTNYLD